MMNENDMNREGAVNSISETDVEKALKKYPLWIEAVTGIAFGFLNLLTSMASAYFGLPLFMDTVFTAAGGFFGWWSGILAALIFHVSSILTTDGGQWSGLAFSICSFLEILIIRLTLKNRSEIKFINLIMLVILCALVISISGAIIYTIIFVEFDFRESTATRYMTYVLLQQQIPVFVSSFISRIPVNFLDKTIAIFAGCGVYRLVSRFISFCTDKAKKCSK